MLGVIVIMAGQAGCCCVFRDTAADYVVLLFVMQLTVVKPSAVCGYGYWVSPQCVQALAVMSPRVFMRQVRMRQGAMQLSQAAPKLSTRPGAAPGSCSR